MNFLVRNRFKFRKSLRYTESDKSGAAGICSERVDGGAVPVKLFSPGYQRRGAYRATATLP